MIVRLLRVGAVGLLVMRGIEVRKLMRALIRIRLLPPVILITALPRIGVGVAGALIIRIA